MKRFFIITCVLLPIFVNAQIKGLDSYKKLKQSIDMPYGTSGYTIELIGGEKTKLYWYPNDNSILGIRSVLNELYRILDANNTAFSDYYDPDNCMIRLIEFTEEEIARVIEQSENEIFLYWQLPIAKGHKTTLWNIHVLFSTNGSTLNVFEQ